MREDLSREIVRELVEQRVQASGRPRGIALPLALI
jgi:hypothetical protein